MEHPNQHLAGWKGLLQADAYGGYNDLYRPDRAPRPITGALCWAHARRKFFELANIAGQVRDGKPAHEISPVALEAVARIDKLFDVERRINGLSADARLDARQRLSRPLVEGLHHWLLAERARLSRHAPVAKAIASLLDKDRWSAFTRFLDHGHVCLSNNASERTLRGVALGRKARLFAGSVRGGERAAFMYALIVTAKLNDIDPQIWLTDVLARLPSLPMSRLAECPQWNRAPASDQQRAAGQRPAPEGYEHSGGGLFCVNAIYHFPGLCCTNRVRDSSRESSVVAGLHEQTDTPDLQDQELARL